MAIESGFQNGTVGVAVGAVIEAAMAPAAEGGASGPTTLSAYSLPSAVYGIVMAFTIALYLWCGTGR